MSGIRLENERQRFFPIQVSDVGLTPSARVVTTAPVHQPTADNNAIGVLVAPFNGKVVGAVFVIAAAGAAGDSTDLKEDYWLSNKGLNFATDVQMTAKVSAMNLNLAAANPDRIPVAGRRLIASGVQGANARCRTGDILSLEFDTTGTAGTATRPKVTPIGYILEADVNVDPMHYSNVR